MLVSPTKDEMEKCLDQLRTFARWRHVSIKVELIRETKPQEYDSEKGNIADSFSIQNTSCMQKASFRPLLFYS